MATLDKLDKENLEEEKMEEKKMEPRKEIKLKSFVLTSIFGVILRFVVFTYFHDYLEDNHSFVAPWNSFQNLRDAISLWKNGIGLYAGDYHSTPWIAFLFAPIVNLDNGILLLGVFTTFDLLAALFLFKFTREFLADKNENAVEQAELVFNIYVLNPLSIGVCSAFSLSTFVNLLLAAALYFNFKKKPFITIALIFLAAQLNIYYISLLFAVTSNNTECKRRGQCIFGSFVLFAVTYALNGLLSNLQDVFNGNVMFFLRVDDHTPNVGNFWYMFTQVFPHYRLFFVFVFQILAFIYAIPLWRILREHPMTLWFIYLQIVAFCSSYPTYAELCAYLPLFFAFSMYHKYYRLTYIIAIALLISFVTSTITLTQWVQSGSGNANFYFGSCCTYILAIVGLAYETINAHLIDQDVKLSGIDDPSAHRFYLNVPAQRPTKDRKAK